MTAAANNAPASPVHQQTIAPRFVLIGGFHGAGKTTLAAKLGAELNKRGRRVAFITNEEGSNLVDTQVLRAAGFIAEHIEGGSFANRFDSLSNAGARLIERSQPNVIIAEPIGTAADLVATVNHPLRRDRSFTVAPFTVIVDPARAARTLGLEKGRIFSDKVAYIYKKQLEEADIILINKTDLISASSAATLRARLITDFRSARVLEASARTGAGLDAWYEILMTGSSSPRACSDMDYAAYAEGEGQIASLNCTVQLSAVRGFDPYPVLRELAETIRNDLQSRAIEIAHLKMALAPDVDMDGVATLNMVGNDAAPETGAEFPEPLERGALIMNLRAETKPDILHAAVTNAMTHVFTAHPNVFARMTHLAHFRPPEQKPMHRLTSI